MNVDLAVSRSARGIVYESRGAGPTVLLVHGWCLDRTIWLYLGHSLVADGFHVVTVDLAGYGESRDLAGPFGLDRHGEDIAALLDELDVTDAVVAGFAFGAAVLLSLPRYDRVAGLVSIGVPDASGAPYLKMRSAMLRDWPLFASRSAGAICGRPQSDAALAWLGAVFARTPLTSAISGVETLAEFVPLDVEQGWHVPSLFVHGADDRIVEPSISAGAAERFTDARLALVPDSGHFVPWDQPAALHELIAGFARDVRPS